jgi:HlyD family secretion protein
MKRWWMLIAVAVVAAAGWGFLHNRGEEGGRHYRMVDLEQGDLESLVSATGTLSAVTTVQVGTQVSGIVDKIFVDFNDPVRKGEVIAQIDTTLLANAVASAKNELERGEAELHHAAREDKRIQALHAKGLMSDEEANTAEYNHETAITTVRAGELALERAKRNLAYATIKSPIDGTVIARTVDPGQTVQASLSAPELFQIAGDLTKMQILASVDESDIGRISDGQIARFTVQAYPDDRFEGMVRQVRLQSTMEENVVNYTVVVDVDNPDGRLLPGMTATVDFIVATAHDATYVPNAALRYRPDEAEATAAFARLREQAGAGRGNNGDSTAGRSHPMRGGNFPRANGPGHRTDRAVLWTLDDSGQLEAVPVRTGITDGVNTEVKGPRLEGVTQVIAGILSQAQADRLSSNPFQSQNGGERRHGPPHPGGF